MNDWNNILELKLKKWALLCDEYSLIHEYQVHHYTKQNKYLFVPTIILSSLSTVVSGISTGSSINNLIHDYNYMLSIIALVLSGISTAIITYTQTIKPEQKIATHKSLSKTYKLINYKIETELALNRKDRINGLVFIKDISQQLQDLIENSDTASLLVLNKIKLNKNQSSFIINSKDYNINETRVNINSIGQGTGLSDSVPSIITSPQTDGAGTPKTSPKTSQPEPRQPPIIAHEITSDTNIFHNLFESPNIDNVLQFQLDRFETMN
jgi:hypothetical protein